MAKTIKTPPRRNTYVKAMVLRHRNTKFGHKANKRSKDAKKSWRRDEW